MVTDNDRSASRFASRTREAWPSLIADLETGKYDVLVLWEPSRGSRDLVVWAALLDTCRRHGVQTHVTSHGRTYDLAQPRDWRTLAEDGVDSAYESEKTSQRILRAMTSNAVAGPPARLLPLRLHPHLRPRTGALTGQAVDPETAGVVREIIQRIAASEPVSVVTEDLNRRNIPSPAGKVWQRAVIRKVALNPAYIAQRTHDGESHAATWEPLVSEADFYGARSVLKARGRVGRRPGRTKHLLSYIATCGVCGAPLGATVARGYFCSSKHCTQAKTELVDSVVEGAIIARLEREDILDDLSGRDDAAASRARDEAAGLTPPGMSGDLIRWKDAGHGTSVEVLPGVPGARGPAGAGAAGRVPLGV